MGPAFTSIDQVETLSDWTTDAFVVKIPLTGWIGGTSNTRTELNTRALLWSATKGSDTATPPAAFFFEAALSNKITPYHGSDRINKFSVRLFKNSVE